MRLGEWCVIPRMKVEYVKNCARAPAEEMSEPCRDTDINTATSHLHSSTCFFEVIEAIPLLRSLYFRMNRISLYQIYQPCGLNSPRGPSRCVLYRL